ncbi:MAG: hypothetical protein H7Y37_04675 [Anaerolineae bacterium]|nr:hypothetical protein [Gloeobacterales cyanobacterium ES-bin-313]
MTILLALKVSAGVVLAADSRLSISEGGKPVFVSDTNTKLFGQSGNPLGIMTCGSAFLQGRAVWSWLDEFIEEKSGEFESPDLAAQGLAQWMPSPDSSSITFVLAGFDPKANHGPDARMLKVTKFSDGTCHHFDLSSSAIFWDGEFDAITRLLLGFAPVYGESLVACENFGSGEVRVPYYAFGLQEGIEYVEFLVKTQIQFQRFIAEPQSCGGPIDIATITPQSGFRWIKRKEISQSPNG